MNEDQPQPLTYTQLRDAVKGNHAAIRLRLRLEPAGGIGNKVFPPTHSGGVYAWEWRRIGPKPDDVVKTVLLDSVQSQANRIEQALLEAHRTKAVSIPLIEVDFSDKFPDLNKVTSLDAPHRIG
ncbi:MAG: hypothetical protein HYU44_15560 [Betaproteobacteria bacterium]|nr:hypothetical protein [Betaproteobacteria bacterium]